MRSVGTALPGFEIEIRSADDQVLAQGQRGEIWLRTGTAMLGYWNKPEASAEVLVGVGTPDAAWGEAVTAVVEWRPGQTATLEELRAFAREHIAGYKLPKQQRSTELLPRTATGKLQRGEVRKRLASRGAD